MRLSEFVWRHRKAVFLIVSLFCAVGIYSYKTLPVAIFPDLAAARIIVTGSDGDAPVPMMLANVTRPLESSVSGVPGITRVHSLTQRGSDELDITFSWGTDMAAALQKVEAKLNQVQSTLPPGTQVQAERLNPSVFPVMGYSLYSSTTSMQDLRNIALYTVRQRLLRVPGVQQINVLGGDSPNYTVTVNAVAMQSRDVTLQNVQDALTKTNEIASVGYYDQSYLHNELLVSGMFKSIKDIGAVTVLVKNRIPVALNEIATIKRDIEPRTIETSGDGHDAVLVDVIKQPSGNTVDVANQVHIALNELRLTLPKDVVISNSYDQSEIVQESQASVLEAVVLGGLLALVVLMLFLGNIRSAAIVLMILPLSILITFGLMKLLGQTLNIMTLGALAIALGLVIDDGIVVVENIYHELESGKPRRLAIQTGLAAITPAMVGSSVTTMVAFLPLTFLSGITGQFFAPLALVMVATLGVSLLLSLLLAPLLAQYLLPRRFEEPKSMGAKLLMIIPNAFKHVIRMYGRILAWCLNRRTVVMLGLIPVAALAWVLFTHIQTGFFPEFDEGGFVVDTALPAGTSLEQSSKVSHQIETIFAHTPEIAAWSRRTGAQLGFDITTQDHGDLSVRLKADRSRNIDEIMNDIRQQIAEKVPSVQVDFHQILQDNIGDIAGSPSPVEIKIYGDDSNTLEALANQIDDLISKNKWVTDDNNGIIHSSPETVIAVDSEKAQRYGLTTDDVRQNAQAAFAGVEPTAIQEGEQSVPIRVVMEKSGPVLDEQSLDNVRVISPVSLTAVSLGDIAKIQYQPGALQITRENQRQMVAVTASLDGIDLGAGTAQLQQQVNEHIHLPPGYSVKFGGLHESQQQSFAQLAAVLVTALMLVFLLLVVQLKSLGQSVSLLIAAILSLVGVLAALLITRTPLNISSFTGAVMIVGIVTENGIVLFDTYNRIKHERPDLSPIEMTMEAATTRLRPILMTTIGAILALFPLALGIGAGAALQKPLAIAVIGGLCVSTLFTLIVAPVLNTSWVMWQAKQDAKASSGNRARFGFD